MKQPFDDHLPLPDPVYNPILSRAKLRAELEAELERERPPQFQQEREAKEKKSDYESQTASKFTYWRAHYFLIGNEGGQATHDTQIPRT